MTTESNDLVRVRRDGTLTWITIHRPTKLNALDRATVEALVGAVRAAIDDPATRAIAVTGAGEKAFVAGADIAAMSTYSASEGQAFARFLQSSLDTIERSPKPVVAAVNGFALGGGCELAMACHVRIASANARFGQPEVNLGLIPGAGGSQRLPRIVGRGRALDLLLTGAMIDAEEAHRIGLVNRVVPTDSLESTVTEYATTLAAKSPMALARCLEAVLSGTETSQEEAMRAEAALFGLCFATDDMKEGTAAFLEKRAAEFSGT